MFKRFYAYTSQKRERNEIKRSIQSLSNFTASAFRFLFFKSQASEFIREHSAGNNDNAITFGSWHNKI